MHPDERTVERFFDREPVEGQVSPAVLRSWRRCRAAGLVPDELDLGDPVELDWDGPLVRAARPVLDRVRSVIADAETGLLLNDDKARLLAEVVGDRVLARELEARHHLPGACYAEDLLGTNAVGSALRERSPFRVSAFEHLAECVRPFTATGVPVLDPLTGRAEGSVTVVCLHGREHPAMTVLAGHVAAAVERRLLEQSRQRERDMLHAFLRTEAIPGLLGGPALRDLSRSDHLILEERAVELIAHGQRAAVRVPLSHGRVAVLRAVPVIESAGVVGVFAQVRIDGGAWEPLAEVPLFAAPALTESAPPSARTATTPPIHAGAYIIRTEPGAEEKAGAPPAPATSARRDVGDDPWLLLVGERGVGRLAASARNRLRLLFEAAMGIGQTLDVVRTAEELAEATVPRFADLVTVDMPEPVLRGGEGTGEPGADLRRVVTRDIEEMPASTGPRRQQGRQVRYPSSSAQARCLAEGGPVPAQEPEAGIRSLIAAPLSTHGGIFGVVTFMRRSTSFEDDDLALAEELSTRTAVCIDNARRFVRERAMALALRRAMLPRSLPEQNAVEVAYRYLPAQQAISGDWFDVIPLSGGRVALVVGDVAGSGLYAAAAMGRLRTAISNFSALDLAPEEILGQLDDLVRRLACEQADRAGDDATGSLGIAAENLMTDGAGDPVTGTTCLYAVYDPAGGQCTLASAGHPPPAVVHPDGSVEFPHKSAGPPLGLAAGPGRAAVRDGRGEASRGQQARALHRWTARRRSGRPPPGNGTAACGAGLLRPLRRRGLRLGADRPAARPAIRRRRLAGRPHPGASGRPRGLLGSVGRSRGGVPRTHRGRPAPVGLEPGRAGLHHRADLQRAGHQRDPVRERAHQRASSPRPEADLRGVRRE